MKYQVSYTLAFYYPNGDITTSNNVNSRTYPSFEQAKKGKHAMYYNNKKQSDLIGKELIILRTNIKLDII